MQIRHRRAFQRPTEQPKTTRINDKIKVDEVRLIDSQDENIGVVTIDKALALAHEAELDLVEVNPKAVPPVCKIMDFGKYKYEQEKLAHKQKVASKKTEIKGIRLSFKIKGIDLENRLNQAKEFLTDKDQVRVELILKGRERAHGELAKQTVENFIKNLGENIKIIQPLQRQGKSMSLIVAAKT